MKPLHDISSLHTGPTHYMWYAALQTRAGRRHLFRVPAIAPDPADLVPPRWTQNAGPEAVMEWRNDPERTRIYIPFHMTPTSIATRMCNTQQTVVVWKYSPPRYYGQNPPHGYCHTCWAFSLNGDYSDTPVGLNQIRAGGLLDADTQQWLTTVNDRINRAPR